MKKFLATAATLCLFASGIACADEVGIAGVNYPLAGGSIAPGSELKISLASLPLSVPFKITCDINATEATISYFGIDTSYGFSVSLNGVLLNSYGSANGNINKGSNVLEINNFIRNKYPETTLLTIKNLDDTVQETVSNCNAVPVV